SRGDEGGVLPGRSADGGFRKQRQGVVWSEEDQEGRRKETFHLLGSTTSVEPSCLMPHRLSSGTVGHCYFQPVSLYYAGVCAACRMRPLGRSVSSHRRKPTRPRVPMPSFSGLKRSMARKAVCFMAWIEG